MGRPAAEAATSSGGMNGLTFDTGALIALERRRRRMAQIYRIAVEDGRLVTVLPVPG